MTRKILQELQSVHSGSSDLSNKIFHLYPIDESRELAACHFDTVSGWVLNHMLEVCAKNEADAVVTFYRLLEDVPRAGTLRGHIFEWRVLNYFDGIDAERDLPIRGLTQTQTDPKWTYRGPIKRVTFGDSALADIIKNAVETKSSLHLVPLARNYPSVDSIVYHPDDGITCIQVTINKKKVHPINVEGLRKIQKSLKLRTPLADLRPSETEPWRFIFIVSPEVEPGFTSQIFIGDTQHGEWAGKVNQYVLGLDLDSAQRSHQQ
jgi:hypothetical protein